MSGNEATADATKGVHPEEQMQEDQSPSDSKESSADLGLLDQPLIVEGKRKRKSVESFQASTATPAKKKRLSISDGQGKKLSDLHLDFGNRQSDELRPLYKLLFNTPGQKRSIKRNIGDFCGFTFEKDDPEFSRRKASLAKFQKQGLVANFCRPLGLSVGGSKDEVIDRILDFLLKPSGKGRAEKVTPKSTGKKKPRKSKASPEKEEDQEGTEEDDTKEDGQGDKEEDEEGEMEKQEESVEKEEGMDKQGAVKNQEEVMKNQEELGEEQEEAVEKEEEEAEGGEEQGEVGEKQEEAENKQEDAVAAEDPPECEKEAAEVMEGEQGDNGVASGEVPDGRDQEMDTNTSPASVDAAKKVSAGIEEGGNHLALEQVQAED